MNILAKLLFIGLKILAKFSYRTDNRKQKKMGIISRYPYGGRYIMNPYIIMN